MSDQQTWEALMDDTDIVMSLDGDKASFYTKRLAGALHFKDRECRDLLSRAEAAEAALKESQDFFGTPDMVEELNRLREAVEWACDTYGPSSFTDELRRRAGKEGG